MNEKNNTLWGEKHLHLATSKEHGQIQSGCFPLSCHTLKMYGLQTNVMPRTSIEVARNVSWLCDARAVRQFLTLDSIVPPRKPRSMLDVYLVLVPAPFPGTDDFPVDRHPNFQWNFIEEVALRLNAKNAYLAHV